MASFTYSPPAGENEVVRTLGRTFVAGEAIDFADDDPIAAKLRGNPHFSEGGKERSESVEKATLDAELNLEKKIDGRTKAAREARRQADEATAKAAEEERQEAALAAARAGRSDAVNRAVRYQMAQDSAKQGEETQSPPPQTEPAPEPATEPAPEPEPAPAPFSAPKPSPAKAPR